MKYFPLYHVTQLADGGYCFHGTLERGLDLDRITKTNGRIEGVAKYLVDTGKVPYQPYKYDNWLQLEFPLTNGDQIPLPDLPEDYVDVEQSLQHLVVLVEKHLFYDRKFESFVSGEGYSIIEWPNLQPEERELLISKFRNLNTFNNI